MWLSIVWPNRRRYSSNPTQVTTVSDTSVIFHEGTDNDDEDSQLEVAYIEDEAGIHECDWPYIREGISEDWLILDSFYRRPPNTLVYVYRHKHWRIWE